MSAHSRAWVPKVILGALALARGHVHQALLLVYSGRCPDALWYLSAASGTAVHGVCHNTHCVVVAVTEISFYDT